MHAFHLLQLVHQVAGVCRRPAVSATSTSKPGPGRLQSVDDDGGGIGAGRLCNHRHVVALAPDLQLLDGRGTKGIARREQDLAAFAA